MQHIVVEETDICKTEICMIIYEKYEMQSFLFIYLFAPHGQKEYLFLWQPAETFKQMYSSWKCLPCLHRAFFVL